MKLSARNQLAGTVTKIAEGAVNGIVTIDVNGTPVSATISMNAIRELGLEPGKKAYAVIKATEVMVGLGEHLALSARNQFPGKVVSVTKGAVNSIVAIEALGGNRLSFGAGNAVRVKQNQLARILLCVGTHSLPNLVVFVADRILPCFRISGNADSMGVAEITALHVPQQRSTGHNDEPNIVISAEIRAEHLFEIE